MKNWVLWVIDNKKTQGVIADKTRREDKILLHIGDNWKRGTLERWKRIDRFRELPGPGWNRRRDLYECACIFYLVLY